MQGTTTERAKENWGREKIHPPSQACAAVSRLVLTVTCVQATAGVWGRKITKGSSQSTAPRQQ